jgi:hypothetical protein
VAGYLNGTLDFDPGPGVFTLNSQASAGGTRDIFILKLSPCQTPTDTLQATACKSYTANGTAYTQSGTYTQRLNTPNGCDSTLVLKIVINQPSQNNNFYALCPGQSLQVGTRIYTQAGIYLDTLIAANGCDSIITSTLAYDIPDDTIQLSAEFGALAAPNQDSYQWLDCNAGFAPITGETDSSFAPTVSGSYAVRVTKGNCADTSNCALFTSGKDLLTSQIRIYPQPVKDKLYIEMPETSQTTELVLMDAMGRIVVKEKGRNIQSISVLKLPAGLYQLKVFTGKEMQVFAVMVEK